MRGPCRCRRRKRPGASSRARSSSTWVQGLCAQSPSNAKASTSRTACRDAAAPISCARWMVISSAARPSSPKAIQRSVVGRSGPGPVSRRRAKPSTGIRMMSAVDQHPPAAGGELLEDRPLWRDRDRGAEIPAAHRADGRHPGEIGAAGAAFDRIVHDRRVAQTEGTDGTARARSSQSTTIGWVIGWFAAR